MLLLISVTPAGNISKCCFGLRGFLLASRPFCNRFSAHSVFIKPPDLPGEIRRSEGTGGALGPWTTLTLTSSKKVIVSGLTPAGIYQFQVRALGKLGYTDWSPSMTFIAA